ncbi:hypothetical protein BRADI_1g41745v3 [Brachypodium distachyon]|uniref:Uncharacterized protein n=1 Tax=Brachypodium distachyon TaxID=15368 RepID=A0A2K2DNR1_BRADI|nr:hypothetical protein BRADI_1g41745v3 [Brachypodium distachyon]
MTNFGKTAPLSPAILLPLPCPARPPSLPCPARPLPWKCCQGLMVLLLDPKSLFKSDSIPPFPPSIETLVFMILVLHVLLLLILFLGS